MNIYKSEMLNEIFTDEQFLTDYTEYREDNTEIAEFNKFIDSIELNRKYFRLEMNKKKGFRSKNKNISEDTIALKEINSLLNKTTDKNVLSIRQKIKGKLENKSYLTEMIIESILEKCIIHTPYISLYLDLINYLYSDTDMINEKINSLTDKIYESIVHAQMIETTDYLIMCEKNKKLDKLIGHSLLITELEKKKIVMGKIHPTLENFMTTLSDCEVDEEKYKCVQCLYNILKLYYGDRRLPESYTLKIKSLINNEKSNKIKFRMMDIIERK
jgi:hypothetical protein|tara:strand:+ start:465 stop:1280 length:816 start_codon:yes stop_codon:yes gene_type:complete